MEINELHPVTVSPQHCRSVAGDWNELQEDEIKHQDGRGGNRQAPVLEPQIKNRGKEITQGNSLQRAENADIREMVPGKAAHEIVIPVHKDTDREEDHAAQQNMAQELSL